ncbi:hypothetical protein [Shimia sp.]|uniref:hypothetical protein n=1 Tax=Shimia sp. TaxID=1954381 RepID=UPI00329A1F0E
MVDSGNCSTSPLHNYRVGKFDIMNFAADASGRFVRFTSIKPKKCCMMHERQQCESCSAASDRPTSGNCGPSLSFPVHMDWTSCGPQACVSAMEKDTKYNFGEAFARLTCLLEDAAGLAADGQSPRLKAMTRVHISDALETALHAVGAVLNEIRAELDQ